MNPAAPPRSVKVGMAQMRVDAGQPQANLARAQACIADAARASCDVVVLPECLDIGWGDSRATQMAQPIPGPHADLLARAAQAHRIVVVAGLVERAGSALYNAAVLIDEQGQLRLLHRKIHELQEVTRGLYAADGPMDVNDTMAASVARTHLGAIGVAICADLLPDPHGQRLDVGTALAHAGAQIILSPCAWAVPPSHDNTAQPYGGLWRQAYGRLAAAHGLPVVGVSSVGVLENGGWAGWAVIGSSLAMAGDGTVVAQGDYGGEAEQTLVATLALRPAMGATCIER